jgi:hypothetical protein
LLLSSKRYGKSSLNEVSMPCLNKMAEFVVHDL